MTSNTEKNNIKTGVTFILIKPSRKILMQLRDSGNGKEILYPNTWCFPGGGKENNEKYTKSLVREIKEEYNIDIKLENCKILMKYDHDNVVNDHIFTCHVEENQEFKFMEGADMKWMDFDEINKLDLGFNQSRILPMLKNYLHGLSE